ncbi:MAG: hypothetical protein O2901_15670 [Verrucomicrobia bacterium]|nr:hypothetical protein [Verrucomicrobiota bacterium]
MVSAITQTAHRAMSEARQEAERLNHSELGTEHLMMGIINAGGDAIKLLTKMGVEPDAVYTAIEKRFPAKARKAGSKRPGQSALMRKVIDHAREAAAAQDSDSVGTEHLLMAILDEKEGGAVRVLKALGADLSGMTEAS